MIHILFKPVNTPGYIKVIGTYLNYSVGRIPDEYCDNRVELHKIDAIVIPENIAPGYKFADIYGDYVSVKKNTQLAEDFSLLQSDEDSTTKVRYFLTEEDRLKYAEELMLFENMIYFDILFMNKTVNPISFCIFVN